MRDSCFEGTAHFVAAGSTVQVVNEGDAPHSLAASDGSFDTGTLLSGEQAEIVIGHGGVIRIFCRLHGTAEGAGMAGVIVAGEAARATAAGWTGWVNALGWLGGGLGGAALALLIVRFRPR
jgi:hypothetical protein